MLLHLKIKSQKLKKKRFSKPTVVHVCKICGLKLCSKRSLNRHMHRHTGFREFSCSVCDAAFIQKHQLMRHFQMHPSHRHEDSGKASSTLMDTASLTPPSQDPPPHQFFMHHTLPSVSSSTQGLPNSFTTLAAQPFTISHPSPSIPPIPLSNHLPQLP